MHLTADRELKLAFLASAVLSVIQWFPALRDPSSTGFGDWQMIQHNWEAAFVALARFHEWPLWDPFHCGGVSILRNPESQLYSPWFLLAFPLGTVLAVKLMLLGHVAFGLTGMYWLARRRYRLHAIAAALCAVAWGCSGRFAWDGAGGHATFLPFAYAPWLVYFVHRRRVPAQEVALTAGILVLTLFEGGTYPLPYFGLMLALELILRARRGAPSASVRFAALVALLLALAGAIRFVPIALALREFPRQVPNSDALTLTDVLQMLTLRRHGWKTPGHPFVWAEYGSYIGWPALLLAALGLLYVLRRGPRHLLIGLALYGLLMLGNFSDYAPFSLLHHFPVYDSLRVPSRFAILFTFYLALLAGHACDRLLHPRAAPGFALLLLLAYTSDMMIVTWPIVDRWSEPPLDKAAPAAEFHLVNRDYYRNYASYPRLNLGTSACYVGGMNWSVSSALWSGARPQLRVVSRRATVHGWSKTPHMFKADLDLPEASRVLFNQNFASGFVASVGELVKDHGRLALDLPAGRHTLELSYRPPEFVPSAAASGVGLALIGLLYSGQLSSSRRRKRIRAMAARRCSR
jgi:hypothetical protein